MPTIHWNQQLFGTLFPAKEEVELPLASRVKYQRGSPISADDATACAPLRISLFKQWKLGTCVT